MREKLDVGNLSGIFGGKVRGLDSPMTALAGVGGSADHFESMMTWNEGKKKKGKTASFEDVAWSRLKIEGNLPMFGDKDKDKVMNIFDCQPYKKKEQALYHKVLSAITGKAQTPVGTLQTYGKEQPQRFETYSSPIETAERVATQPQPQGQFFDKVGGFLKNVRAIKNPQKTPQEKLEEERLMFEKRKQEAVFKRFFDETDTRKSKEAYEKLRDEYVRLREEKARLDEARKQEAARYGGTPVGYGGYGGYGGYQTPMGDPIRQIIMGTGSAGNAISGGVMAVNPLSPYDFSRKAEALYGMRGSYPGIYENVRFGNMPFVVKVDQMVGSGELAKEWREKVGESVGYPITREAESRPFVQPTYEQPMVATPTVRTGGATYSPYSRRPVTYTRGPYKRHAPQYRY